MLSKSGYASHAVTRAWMINDFLQNIQVSDKPTFAPIKVEEQRTSKGEKFYRIKLLGCTVDQRRTLRSTRGYDAINFLAGSDEQIEMEDDFTWENRPGWILRIDDAEPDLAKRISATCKDFFTTILKVPFKMKRFLGHTQSDRIPRLLMTECQAIRDEHENCTFVHDSFKVLVNADREDEAFGYTCRSCIEIIKVERLYK